MKQSLSLIALLCALFMHNTIKAAETEPNNSSAQANTLALNGNNSGKIDSGGDQDWWKVTTTGDGKLSVTLTPLSGKYTWVYLYDNNGTIQLGATYSTSAFTVATDGLAAGTYYIKVICYYGTDTGSYTISNTLTQPAQANDVEPNGNRGQAKILLLNGNRKGHVGYYYNNLRDTADWWKITTAVDGKLNLTLTPANNEYVWIYLYDNNGTTLLNSSYSATTFTQSTDGLAAGTYYIKIICYYSSKFAPYTLSNTLTVPAQTNDTEPNGTRATALTLSPNATTRGHVGYYYNNLRDTADWYKITTTTDGQLKLSLTPANNEYVWIYLYDNNGTTLLNSSYSSTAFTQLTDGLAPGTYYVRINCYYNSKFAPYTFTDSLLTYTNSVDAESNAKPYLAKTLTANTSTPGHTGFYYNNQRDSLDWWKINYTGTGALTVALNLEATKQYGYQYTWMEIYKDTAAAAIYAQYVAGANLTANLTSLTQGYYWVRVRCYYNSQFESYTLTPTFTQTAAKITLRSSVSAPDCSSTNSITYRCTVSKPPYTVQLYRFGVAYGSPRIVTNTSNFTFTALPYGQYTATAFGDGASGTAFGTSQAVTLAAAPTSLNVTNITATGARLNWGNVQNCVSYYRAEYRVLGTTAWSSKRTNGPVAFSTLYSLTANTTYEWHVAPTDTLNGIIGTGTYSALDTFTTAVSFAAKGLTDESDITAMGKGLNIYPNPANTHFTLQYNPEKSAGTVSLWLKNMNGSVVWSKNNIAATAAKGTLVDVSRLPSGIYMLHITDQSNNTVAVKKVVVSR